MLDLLLAISQSYFHFFSQQSQEGIDPPDFKHDGIEHGIVFFILKRNVVFNGDEEENFEVETLTNVVNFYLCGLKMKDALLREYGELTEEKIAFWESLDMKIKKYYKELIVLYDRSSNKTNQIIKNCDSPQVMAANLSDSL